jgi:putative ABC transport system permease protein
MSALGSVRFRKVLGDLRAERGRISLMIVAIAVSLSAFAIVLGARAILSREIAVNYLGTRPADATLEMAEGIGPELLRVVRAMPGVADAEAREILLSRVRVGDDFRPLLLFALRDFSDVHLNAFHPASGAWPPPPGTVLIERSARAMAQAGEGDFIEIVPPHGTPRTLRISGVVHDPGLAPAWQEREVYAYASADTLAALGESGGLHELGVTFRSASADIGLVQAKAEALAQALAAGGHAVRQVRVPPPRMHPHQRQMATILLLLLAFAVLSLVVSAVLVASTLSALLARQVREIGVMKTIGARERQLATMYGGLVALLGGAAGIFAIAFGTFGARFMAVEVSTMLNFELTSRHIPARVYWATVAFGVGVPLLVAWFPIRRAIRIPVRDALDRHGADVRVASLPVWLPAPVRDALRRPARFVLTVLLLATGGALFVTALSLSRAWERNIDKIYETRHYDVEVRFRRSAGETVAARLRGLPDIRTVEQWGYSAAAFGRTGHVDVVRTYPDRSHGSLTVLAPPPSTRLIGFPVIAGRWLDPKDDDGVVLSHVAAAQAGGVTIGQDVTLSLDGLHTTWKLIGIVEEVGSAGVAYVTDSAFVRVTHSGNTARMLRIATTAATPAARADVIRSIERELAAADIGVETVLPFSELRTAIGDHVVILVRALVAMSVVFAVVGLLGLGSAIGVSVVERTREIGVMKAIGAGASRIVRIFVGEAAVASVVSWMLGSLLSAPLTWAIEGLVGRVGFLAPLPFVISAEALFGWLALIVVAGFAASFVPARRAASLSVREALATT